jgi:hypothetical protein
MVGSFRFFMERYVRETMARRGEINWQTKRIPYGDESFDFLYRNIWSGN